MKLARTAALLAAFFAAAAAPGQDGGIPLSGDAAFAPAFDDQKNVQIAAGGPGYLAVWEDERTVLGPFINAGYEPLLGNQRDIYAARLDTAGNPLDAAPILISNLGRNQKQPQVAWNGSHWLVVFVSERPDWYFFEDVVGVRVAADGTVLDATPIAIRPELNSPANYKGQNPTVLGRSGDWVVTWEDWNPANQFPSIKAARVSDAGVVLDPGWPTLQEHNVAAFGPRNPRLVAAGSELVLVWLELTQGVRYRRISSALAPLAAPVLIPGTTSQIRPQVASDGQTALVLAGLKAWRIGAGGALLDAAPILVSTANFNAETTPTVAWNGASFSATFSISPGGTFIEPSDVFLVRIAASGQVLDLAPITAAGTGDHERLAAVAGANGATQFVYQVQNSAFQEDVRASRVAATGAADPPRDLAVGLARQEYVQIATTSAAHVAVFASRSSGTSRVLLTRVAADGTPLAAEPVLVASGSENWRFLPDVGFDGERLLVVWNDPAGGVLARRYAADLAPIDPAPFTVFTVGATPSVAGNSGTFLVAATVLFSGDQNQLLARRVQGDGTVLDAGALILGGGWAESPVLAPFGAGGYGFVAVWTRRPTHDSPASTVHARVVLVDGALATGDLIVSTSGGGLDPDVAVAGDRALIVWCDDVFSAGDRIEGRLLFENGTFGGPDILIDDAPFHQSFPAVATDGARFVVAWIDYRAQLEIEQLRGDVYAARVALDGTVEDPLGIQVTTGALPEDLVRLAALDDVVRAFWLDLRGAAANGGTAHVQRVMQRGLDDLAPGPWQNLGFAKPGSSGTPALFGVGAPAPGSSVTLAVANAAAAAPLWLVVGGARLDLPFLGGVLVPSPQVVLPLATDAGGGLALPVAWPAGVPAGTAIYLQAWIADGGAAQGTSATNGLSVHEP